MRSLRRFSTGWMASALCITTLVVSLLGAVMVSSASYAQSRTIELAVVDFRNTSKIPNEMFGTMATDAVVVESLRSGKFSVTASDALQGKMEELGYKGKGDRFPKVVMTPAMMVRLGQEVGADAVVTGEITSIKVDGNKKAEARVSVRMLDVASGVWMNGANATGSSNPRIGYSADKDTDLIIEAINNAARQAVETMVQFIIPEATIIGTFGAEAVLLNKGAQDGMQPGMEMIVLRRGDTGVDEVVGRIKISSASDTDARGSIVSSTRGLKPEDRVRAVFELPKDSSDNGKPKGPDTQKRITKGSNMLWGLVALVGIASMMGGGGEKAEKVASAACMAGMTPDISSTWAEGGILLLWNDPRPIKTSNIVQYHIWRDNMGSIFGTNGAVIHTGIAFWPDATTAMSLTTPVGTFEHSAIENPGIFIASAGFKFADIDHALGDGTVTDSVPMSVGIPHRYWISCLYGRQTSASDGTPIVTYWETSPAPAGMATFVNRPVCESPGGTVASDFVDLTNVTFAWKSSAGADQYVIEVSSTPDFIRSKTWVNTIYQPSSQDGITYTKSFVNVLKNADTAAVVPELSSVQPGDTLFWRVGARNRLDTPGPIPAGPSPTVSGAKNTRYIYSDPNMNFMFMTLPDLPNPPPVDPGGGSGGGGENPPPPPL